MLNISIIGNILFTDEIKGALQRCLPDKSYNWDVSPEYADLLIYEGHFSDFKEYPDAVFINIDTLDDKKHMYLKMLSADEYEIPISYFDRIVCSVFAVMSKVRELKIALQIDEDELFELKAEHKNDELNRKAETEVQRNVMSEVFDVEDLETELIYIPKSEVSGDFVTTQKIFDKIFIFFGDVTGHGSYGGMYGASLISLAKGYLANASKMTANLQSFAIYLRDSAFFYHGGYEGSSSENIICEIDLKEHKASFCTFAGGTISPLIIKQNGKIITVYGEEEIMNGKILPRMGDTIYEDISPTPEPVVFDDIKAGDTILFYTDGITELFSTKSSESNDVAFTYGPEKLAKIIKETVSHKGNKPEVLVKSLVADVTSYGIKGLETGATLKDVINDDATIYCIRIK